MNIHPRIYRRGFALLLLLTISLVVVPRSAFAQDQTGDTAANKAKAEAIVNRAIAAMGGAAYTSVRTVVGTGRYTPFDGGVSSAPFRFEDFVLFPDKNRTEFYGRGNFVVQTNTADSGWLFDAQARKIDDAKPEQIEDYNLALRTSIDSLLRGAWRGAGKNRAELSYVGRREAGLGRRNEAVRLTYADGFTVDFEFSARDGLPAKVTYKRMRKKENASGIEEPVEVTEEDRFAQFIETNGVRLPFIIDHFRAGIQTSRVNYESIAFNQPLPDSLFARPANVKEALGRKKK